MIFSISNLAILFMFLLHLMYSSISKTAALFQHLLLFSLVLGSSSTIANLILDPTPLSSCYTSLLFPISHTLIFSSILVRLLHLMFMLPTLYQTLLFFFSSLVQMSLSVHVLLLTQFTECPPHTSFYSSPITDLFSLYYPCLLLISTTVLSTKVRTTPPKKYEARAIWILSLLSIGVWIMWVSSGLLYQQYYAVIKGFGLEAEILLTILLLLLPSSIGQSVEGGSADSSPSCYSCSVNGNTSSYMG